MKLGDVFILLGIFIIGSLIVTFLVSPESFNIFKNNIKGLYSTTTGNMINIPKIQSKLLSEDTIKKLNLDKRILHSDSVNYCTMVKNQVLLYNNPEVTEELIYRNMCISECGNFDNQKVYHSAECIDGDLICYCEI